jgi:AraC-like DNA-binding protein
LKNESGHGCADPRPLTMFSAGRVAPFLRHAARSGWSPEALSALCASHGVALQDLYKLTTHIPESSALAMVQAVCDSTSDINLGLHLAREAHPSWMSLLGVLGASLATVREAVELCSEYGSRITGRPSPLRVDEAGRLRVHRGSAPAEPTWPRQLVEADLAAVLVMLRRFTATPVNAHRVTFRHGAPVDLTEHIAVFGTSELRFEAPVNELVLPAHVLELPLDSADPALALYLRGQVDAELEALGVNNFPNAVRRCLRDALGQGLAPTLNGVARAFKTTERTLQRRLADDGVGFAALLDEARYARVRELLLRADLSLEDVAERSGLSDARSLRRALKRRTGQTPSELRRQGR